MSSSTSPIAQSIFRTHTFYGRIRSSRIFWRNATSLPAPTPTPTPSRLTVPNPHPKISPHIINYISYISSQARRRSCFLSHTPQLRHRLSSPMSSLTDLSDSTTKTVRVVVKGRVQGVFYRNWTIENAKELGLRGWVRNRRDGSVEALISGSADKVEEMEQRCRRGPPAARVTGFEVSPCSDDPGTGFERRQTV